MARSILVAALMLLLTVVLVSSAPSGLVGYVTTMTRRRLAVLVGAGGLVLLLGWAYLSGDVDYWLWLHSVPTRPAEQLAFVDKASEARDQWTAERNTAAREALCTRQTAELDALTSSVANWAGTVSTVYLVGTGVALVVRVGRNVQMRTGYFGSETVGLPQQGTPTYQEAITLKSGDAVRFSGSSIPVPEQCIFDQPKSDIEGHIDVLFKFTELKAT